MAEAVFVKPAEVNAWLVGLGERKRCATHLYTAEANSRCGRWDGRFCLKRRGGCPFCFALYYVRWKARKSFSFSQLGEGKIVNGKWSLSARAREKQN